MMRYVLIAAIVLIAKLIAAIVIMRYVLIVAIVLIAKLTIMMLATNERGNLEEMTNCVNCVNSAMK
jgi:hypothetical protein